MAVVTILTISWPESLSKVIATPWQDNLMAQDTAVNDPSDICCCGKSKSQTSRFMTGKKNIDYFTMQVHDESWCPKKCTRSNIHVINKWATTLLIKYNFQYTSLKKPAQIWAPIPKEYKNMPTLFSLQNKSTIYMQEVKPIPSTLNWPPYHPSNKYQHGNWLPTQLHLPLPTSQGAESIQHAARSKPHLTITVLLQPVVEPGTFLAALSEE
jgi:hypothetical protein